MLPQTAAMPKRATDLHYLKTSDQSLELSTFSVHKYKSFAAGGYKTLQKIIESSSRPKVFLKDSDDMISSSHLPSILRKKHSRGRRSFSEF